jgi:hypothetical protein
MRLSLLIAGVAITVAASSVVTAPSQAAARSTWYWSPGLCKTNLQRYGVRINDGRTFHIAQAFCVGRGGPASCEWSPNGARRLYNHLVVFARSFDNIVRGFDLYPTGRNSYRVQGITQFKVGMTAAQFIRFYGSIAASTAKLELEKGCAPSHP